MEDGSELDIIGEGFFLEGEGYSQHSERKEGIWWVRMKFLYTGSWFLSIRQAQLLRAEV